MLMLTRGERNAASSRLRSYQFVPWFEEAGVAVTAAPLLTGRYITRLYQGCRPELLSAGGRYIARVWRMLSARRYDVLWIEQEVLPWMPAWCDEALLKWAAIPCIVDYDDAVYQRYRDVRGWGVPLITHNKIGRLMRRADVVIAGNAEIARYAAAAGALRVKIVPTAVDPRRYDAGELAADGLFRVCWVGTPITAKFLEIVRGPLTVFCRESGARLTVIGAPEWKGDEIDVEHIAWSEESEAASIARCDIGIMPLYDGAFERGKCGYKLLQYMACRRPVIASPVGVNQRLVKEGVNGFLAGSAADWLAALRKLYGSAEVRREMGRAGRDLVEKEYSVQAIGPRLADIVKTTRQNWCTSHGTQAALRGNAYENFD
jgi:glycosyltransferase involved in cell wall biosynthesis